MLLCLKGRLKQGFGRDENPYISLPVSGVLSKCIGHVHWVRVCHAATCTLPADAPGVAESGMFHAEMLIACRSARPSASQRKAAWTWAALRVWSSTTRRWTLRGVGILSLSSWRLQTRASRRARTAAILTTRRVLLRGLCLGVNLSVHDSACCPAWPDA